MEEKKQPEFLFQTILMEKKKRKPNQKYSGEQEKKGEKEILNPKH